MNPSTPSVEEIVPGIFRLGTVLTGFYLIEEDEGTTLVDGGLPGYLPQLEAFLSGRDRDLAAVTTQVLTHHHADHRGITERVRTRGAAPVWVHHLDRPFIGLRQRPPRAPLWRPRVLMAFAHMFRRGIVRTPPVLEAHTFRHGEVLDVPGHPEVLHVPGHTPGNSALLLRDRGVLITGDALITIDIHTWERRPSITADFFNDDSERALDSLSVLEHVDADLLLPGHGPVWSGPPAEAVRIARNVGIH